MEMSTEKSVAVCMDYHKQESSHRNYSKNNYLRPDTHNPRSHPVTGNTNGALLVHLGC
jgi:hypothetical protein